MWVPSIALIQVTEPVHIAWDHQRVLTREMRPRNLLTNKAEHKFRENTYYRLEDPRIVVILLIVHVSLDICDTVQTNEIDEPIARELGG